MTYIVKGRLKADPNIIIFIRENIADLKEAQMEVSFAQIMSDKYFKVWYEEIE